MTAWERELLDVLEEETDLLRRLADLAQQKHGALRLGDVGRIDGFTGRERALVGRFAEIEERRRQGLQKAGLAGRSLRELIGLARGPAAGRLHGAYARLGDVSARLQTGSRRNQELIRARLEWTGRLLRVMAPERQMYDSRGSESRGGSLPGMVDRRI